MLDWVVFLLQWLEVYWETRKIWIGVMPGFPHYAEWNIFVDPLAAKVLFDSGIPLTLVPLDACNHVEHGAKAMLQNTRIFETPDGKITSG